MAGTIIGVRSVKQSRSMNGMFKHKIIKHMLLNYIIIYSAHADNFTIYLKIIKIILRYIVKLSGIDSVPGSVNRVEAVFHVKIALFT